VHAGAEHPQVAALRAAGVPVQVHPEEGPDERAAALRARAAEHGGLVWLVAPDGDAGLGTALAGRTAEAEAEAEVEVLYGSWDPPGARLLDAVAVMDRLRSPGGCPWDARQTHTSLMPYLLEEAYEAHDALAAEDMDALAEELGDVLLQVLFHARIAEEGPEDEGWSVDDVAAGLVDKLVRRHPHVFAGTTVSGAEEVHANWEAIKRREKQRSSAVDGLPLGQPALALAAGLLARAGRAGISVEPPGPAAVTGDDAVASEDALGAALFALVAAARTRGLDPEAALRRAALGYADRIRAAERPAGERPGR